jgi:hypothetical protein
VQESKLKGLQQEKKKLDRAIKDKRRDAEKADKVCVCVCVCVCVRVCVEEEA